MTKDATSSSPRLTLGKDKRLHRRNDIDLMFKTGASFTAQGLRFVYCPAPPEDASPLRALFVVSRKKHRKAVTRNLIRRRMRDAYRRHQDLLYAAGRLYIGVIYLPTTVSDYPAIEAAMLRGLTKLAQHASA